MRRLLALSAFALLAFASPSMAASSSGFFVAFSGPGKTLAEWQGPLHVAGSVRVDYQGNGLSGTLTWTPGADGATALIKRRVGHRIVWDGVLSANDPESGPTVTTVTHRRLPDGSDSSCLDASSRGPDVPSIRFRRGAFVVALTGQFAANAPLAGRCAGPLTSDIGKVLPKRSLSPTRLLHGATLDFTATRPFTGGELTGTVTSTLVLRVGRLSRESSHGSTPHLPGIKNVKQIFRTINVGYRVLSVHGSLGLALRGAPAGACELLDSCATTGTLSVTPRARGATAYLSAFSTHTRRGFDVLRGAVGLGPFHGLQGIIASGDISIEDANVAETLHRDDGSGCADQLPRQQLDILLRPGARGLTATGQDYSGSLRTRCPGPLTADAPLWTGSVPRSALSHRQLTIRLTRQRSLSDDGWLARTTGSLSIVLRRGAVQRYQQTVVVPALAGLP